MKIVLGYFVFFLVILQISQRLVAGQHYEFQSGISHGFMNSRKDLYKHAIPRILMELDELALSEESTTTKDSNVDLTPTHQSLTASKSRIIHVSTNAHLNPDEDFTTEDYPRPRPNHPSVAISNEEFTTQDYPRPRPNHPSVTLSNEEFNTEDYPRPHPNHP